MATRLFAFLFLAALSLPASSKKTSATARGENEDVILTVTLHVDPADAKELIGSDLDGHYIVAEVRAEPKYGKDVRIDHDDFTIRSDKDGEKAKPFVASQIAGSGALVLSDDGQPKSRGSKWGLGGPIMIGGGGGGAGSPEAQGPSKVTMKNGDQENPLKKVLEAKSLPEKKTSEPVSGLLYFPMEKQKLKDLELIYGTREDPIRLRFK